MSRIRSVHPGLWTDERFVSVSPLARLLFIGIWNECDDAGSFEWSPIKLKMRLLPADNADAGELLAELEAAGCLRRYEIEGRQLGAVRNFATYQRPKKPNSVYPQTPEVRKYAGHKDTLVGNQLPTGGEKASQMEDGGGRREEGEREEVDAADAASSHLAFEGRTVRLTEIDLQRWRKAFGALPDIEAELTSIDAWFDAHPPPKGKWFHQASGMLSKKHQALVAERSVKQPAVPL